VGEAMEELPSGAERQVVEDSLPKGMERRLVLRLLSYWRELAVDGQLPSFADVDPVQIPDMWANCFVLDVAGQPSDPVFRTIGRELAERIGMDIVDNRVSDTPEGSLVHVAVSYLQEVLDKKVPISRGGEFNRPDGMRVLYRSILLPMSDDGENISGLLGAANCRDVTDDQEA
jgi:hypothetical protein